MNVREHPREPSDMRPVSTGVRLQRIAQERLFCMATQNAQASTAELARL